MLPSTDSENSSAGFHLDNPSSLSSETTSHLQLHLGPGKRDSNGLRTPPNAYRLNVPLSPTNRLISTTDIPKMAKYAATTAGTPAMGKCIPRADGSDSNNFMSMTDPPLFDPDLYDDSRLENQYGAICPVWMYKGQQQQATTGKEITFGLELTRLDAQQPREPLLTFEACYGQLTPRDESSSKGSPLLHRRESIGSATSFTSLDIGQLSKCTSKPRKSSSALTEEIEDISQDLQGTRTKNRQQRKARARNGPTAAYLDLQEKEKREASLARNRVAASKCRERKKEWVANVEENERNLRIENEALHAHQIALTNELISLKNKALEHVDCECEPIREYLMLSARKTINQKEVLGKVI